MILSLRNLPHDITLHEVCEMFHADARVSEVHFSDDGNPDKVIAWVRFHEVSRVELNRMVDHFNRCVHKNRRIEAYAPLFFQ